MLGPGSGGSVRCSGTLPDRKVGTRTCLFLIFSHFDVLSWRYLVSKSLILSYPNISSLSLENSHLAPHLSPSNSFVSFSLARSLKIMGDGTGSVISWLQKSDGELFIFQQMATSISFCDLSVIVLPQPKFNSTLFYFPNGIASFRFERASLVVHEKSTGMLANFSLFDSFSISFLRRSWCTDWNPLNRSHWWSILKDGLYLFHFLNSMISDLTLIDCKVFGFHRGISMVDGNKVIIRGGFFYGPSQPVWALKNFRLELF